MNALVFLPPGQDTLFLIEFMNIYDEKNSRAVTYFFSTHKNPTKSSILKEVG